MTDVILIDFLKTDVFMEVAIEVKSTRRIHQVSCRGLKALADSHSVKRLILISFENEPKMINEKIECLPWETFIKMLWEGQIICHT